MTTPPKSSSAPVDRTRAIVEAAQAFAKACERDAKVGLGLVVTPEGRALKAALALPVPEWTTKLPDEPDRYYWMRSPDDARCVFVGFYCAGVEHMEFRIAQHNRDEVLTREQAEFYGWEFWPVPIEPPGKE